MVDLQTAGRVVVGTDGSPTARYASEWAAGVAAGRSEPLLLVCVVTHRSTLARLLTPEESRSQVVTDVEEAVAAEQEHLEELHPGLVVETAVIVGSPAEVLVDATRDAALVVVGARGHSAPLRVQNLGGLSDAVATHAQGPVAVIPEGTVNREGPVVVGVDDAPEARAAIRLGFQIAERTGCELVAVHGYQVVASRTRYYNRPTAEIEAELAAEVDRIVAPLAADHPQVRWQARVIGEHPVWALVEASQTASVVVLGARGGGGFRHMLLGSTGREVLRNATCPVYVVRCGD